jgi:hypothetical protein
MDDREIISYVLERINNQASTNQLVIVLEGKCCKIERENYFPDDNGLIEFHKKLDWTEPGYSIAELLELLEKYHDRISRITFEAVDGNQYEPLNIYESDSIGDAFTYSCFILVGDPDAPIDIQGNPQSESWTSDRLGRNRTFHTNY